MAKTVEEMSKTELMSYALEARQAVDFIMERVNEVVTANKKLVKEKQVLQNNHDGIWETLGQRNQEVINLNNILSQYKAFRLSLQRVLEIPITE